MSSEATTYSKFYYDFIIDETNYLLDFTEGAGPELTATFNVGQYTLTTMRTEVERALEDAGALDYTVTVDRTTRLFTISAPSTFGLLVSTGTHIGTSPFDTIGFTGADRTGASTYTANNAAGSEYIPQFKLQSYISSEDWQEASDASVNKAADGRVEVISFGTVKYVQMQIKFATDIDQGCGGPIKNNPTGVEDLRLFMRYLILRAPIEFMVDENTPATFQTLVFDSCQDSNTGTGYKLKELYDKNAPGYFETAILKFRVRE
jgi:hypothetical protein